MVFMKTDVKYVKLIAKPNTWFKEGCEVYTYDCGPDNPVRMTLVEWEDWNNFVCLASGIRVCSKEYSYEMSLYEDGEERWDGENCSCSEFEVEIVNDPC